MRYTLRLMILTGAMASVPLVGCQKDSANAPEPSVAERTPQERMQLVVDEFDRRMQPVDEVQVVGGRRLRIQYLVEEVSDPVFSEPKNETDPLTAEVTIRTQSIVTSLDLGEESDVGRSPAKTDQDKPASSEEGRRPLGQSARAGAPRKPHTQETENSETLVFQFQDGSWRLASENVSEALLGDVNAALELQ